MIAKIAPALLLVFLTGLVALPAPPVLESENIELIYLADARPILMRIDLNSDGKSLEVRWRRFVDLLLVYLDKNNDESLDEEELKKLPMILSFLTNGGEPIPLPKDRGTGVFREQLANHLRENGYQPFRLPSSPTEMAAPRNIRFVTNGPSQSAEAIDTAILDALDTDKDGKLSAQELAAAEGVLRKYDSNDDELISVSELMRAPENSPFGFQQSPMMAGSATTTFDLFRFSRTGSNADLAKRIVRRYYVEPKTKPETEVKKKLNRDMIGLSPEVFAKLDRNDDGQLDAEELDRIGTCPVDASLTVNIGKVTSKQKMVEPKPGKKPALAIKLIEQTSGSITIDTPNVQLHVMAAPILQSPGGDTLLNQFMNADRDGNGYVDKTEARVFPLINAAFDLIDADHNEKIFIEEIQAFSEETADLRKATDVGFASASVLDQGRGLFGLFDTDRDGVLSTRELKNLPKLLALNDRNKDGMLDPKKVSKNMILTFEQGLSQARSTGLTTVSANLSQPNQSRKQVGPKWFQKMDRNGDGDVSRREFLGTDEDFRKIDTDGDGLIDAKEAEAAEALFKKAP